jgi:hypothetical protein
MAKQKNWAVLGKTRMPIASLASDYKGPVVFYNEDQTVQWFSKDADRSPVENKKHAHNEHGALAFDLDKEGQQHPVLESETVEPAFWAPAEEVK